MDTNSFILSFNITDFIKNLDWIEADFEFVGLGKNNHCLSLLIRIE